MSSRLSDPRVDVALERLRQSGHRQTLLRTSLVRTLAEDPTHQTVAQLAESITVRLTHVDHSGLSRTINDLVEAGVLCLIRTASGRAFGLADPVHHHGVCVSCEGIIELRDEDVAPAVAHLGSTTGFETVQCGLMLTGQCADCQQPGVRSDGKSHPVPSEAPKATGTA